MAIDLEKYKKKPEAGSLDLNRYKKQEQQVVQVVQPQPQDILSDVPRAIQGAGRLLGTQGMAKTATQGLTALSPEVRGLVSQIGSQDEGYENLLQTALREQDPIKKERLLSQARRTQMQAPSYSDITQITGEEQSPMSRAKSVLGSALQMGTSLVGSGIPASKTLGQAALTGAGVSGVSAFGAGVEADKTIGEAAKGSIAPTIFGGLLGMTGFGIQQGIKKLTQAAPEKLMDKALKTSQKIKEAGKSPAKDLIKKGWWGPLKDTYQKTQKGIDYVDDLIDQELTKSTVQVKTDDLGRKLLEEATSKYGKNYSSEQINKALLGVPMEQIYQQDSLSLKELNTLRKSIDKIIGSPSWSRETSKINQDISKTVANVMRNLVKESAPVTKSAFAEYAKLINAQKVLNSAISNSSTKFGLDVKDIMVGLGLGIPTGQVVPGIAAIAGKRIMESPTAQSAAAVGLSRLGDLMQKTPPLIVEGLGKAGRQVTSGLLKSMNR